MDRNLYLFSFALAFLVALRKESVDRNPYLTNYHFSGVTVALRKESVDRNFNAVQIVVVIVVALRKESVDRNFNAVQIVVVIVQSLSARRAWIEIQIEHQ